MRSVINVLVVDTRRLEIKWRSTQRKRSPRAGVNVSIKLAWVLTPYEQMLCSRARHIHENLADQLVREMHQGIATIDQIVARREAVALVADVSQREVETRMARSIPSHYFRHDVKPQELEARYLTVQLMDHRRLPCHAAARRIDHAMSIEHHHNMVDETGRANRHLGQRSVPTAASRIIECAPDPRLVYPLEHAGVSAMVSNLGMNCFPLGQVDTVLCHSVQIVEGKIAGQRPRSHDVKDPPPHDRRCNVRTGFPLKKQ